MAKGQKTQGRKIAIVEPGQKVIAKKAGEKTEKKVTMADSMKKIFAAKPRQWTIGTSIPHRRDLTHFVAWPHYIRLQRQKKILIKRLKCPPSVNLFNHSLTKETAVALFKFMDKMKPLETAEIRKQRIEAAKKIAETKKVEDKKAAAAQREEIVRSSSPSALPASALV